MPHLYYSILTTLSEAPHGCLRMTDLAEALKITRSRLTYAVTRLERDGAVRREGCRLDKRGSLAFLTDEGMALMERTAPGHIATVHACLFEHLTERQVGQLEKICTEVARALQGGDGAQTAPDDLPWRRRSSTTSTSTPCTRNTAPLDHCFNFKARVGYRSEDPPHICSRRAC